MIAGTGAESAIETLRLTEHAAALGYDVALVRTPHYYSRQMQPLNMLSFFRFVGDRSPLPVVIYNAPHTTGYDIPAEVVVELAEHPNVIGIKESSGSPEKLRSMVEGTRHIHRHSTVSERFEAMTGRMLKSAATGSESALVPAEALAASAGANPKPSSAAVQIIGKLRTRQKDVGFQIMAGSARQLHECLQAGANGASLPFASAAPGACFEIYAAFRDGRRQPGRTKTAADCEGSRAYRG